MKNRPFTLRLAGLGCLASLTLVTGCAVQNTAPVEPAAPAAPAPVTVTTLEALQGDGLFFFDDNTQSRLQISDRADRHGTYRVTETFTPGKHHGFSWGTGAAALLNRGRAVKPEHPDRLKRISNDHVVLTFKDHKDLRLHIRLEPTNVAGEPIRDYLKTRAGRPSTASHFIRETEVFPDGAVAFRPVLWIERDELIIPSTTAFTGSKRLEDFSLRFTRATPYCLRFLPGKRVEPIGLNFREPIVKKTERTRSGRHVEKAQSGTVDLYRTKKGTLFCQKISPERYASADWHLRYINGTRALTFDFPDRVPAPDFGLSPVNRNKMRIAIAEQNVGGDKKAVPAYVWLKNAPVRDAQYRFNAVAARAVQNAIRSGAVQRAAWDKANQSEVLERARAIAARNARGGRARHR